MCHIRSWGSFRISTLLSAGQSSHDLTYGLAGIKKLRKIFVKMAELQNKIFNARISTT
jgi:hypothetical protein